MNGGSLQTLLATTGRTTTVCFYLPVVKKKDADRGHVLTPTPCFTQPDTLTGKTQWTRPRANAFVIPLGLIQACIPFLVMLMRPYYSNARSYPA